MVKFESLQKDESRAQLADSSKAYRKPRAGFLNLWAMEEFLIDHSLMLLELRKFCKRNLLIENVGSS